MLIDGLQCGHFNRKVFEELRAGNVSCVTITGGFWEGCIESMDAIARWRDLLRANDDIVMPVLRAGDIDLARETGKTGIVIGFQNTNLFDNRIRFVELFAELGVRVVQLTYNNQNEYGGSCYEPLDSGLSRAGQVMVRELNARGILIDLSHVGETTSQNVIEHSLQPVAITHANPHSVVPHKRNKTDKTLALLKERGGIIGCASYRNICAPEHAASAEKWAEIVARTVDLVGIDHVGIGTDRSHGHSLADMHWMRMGRWTREIDYGAGSPKNPGTTAPLDWFTQVRDIGRIPGALGSVGFSAEEVEAICFGNWRRVYGEVFAATETHVTQEKIYA